MMIDPLCQSPFYDRYLCAALKQTGLEIELWTREPTYLHGYFSKATIKTRGMACLTKALFGERGGLCKFLKYAELLFVDLARLFVAAFRADVVHVQWFSPVPLLFFERLVYSLLRRMGKKVVHTVHNVFPHDEMRRHTKRWQEVYGTFDAIISTTGYGKRLMNECFTDLPPVIVVPHGPFFHDIDQPSSEEAKRAIGVGQDRLVVLLQGFVNEYKGIEILVPAFEQCVSAHPNAVLVIAGTGGNQKYIDEVANLIRRSAIPPENILTRFEFIPFDQLLYFYAAADLIVLPYKHIYQSAALFTAMSFSKPIVATSVGGFPEVIEDRVNGRLVVYGDTESLASVIKELLSSEKDRKELGNAAYRSAIEKFSWSTIAEQTAMVYRKMSAREHSN